MKAIFDLEGPIFQFLSKLADLAIVNILWMICCIPVVTIGASTTALYYVCLKLAKDEEGHIIAAFFKSFKENFKQATVITLIYLVIGGVLAIDVMYLPTLKESLGAGYSIFRALSFAGVIVFMFIYEFTFPVLSRFENTTQNTIRNAFFMGVGNFPKMIVILLVNLLPFIALVIDVAMFIKLVFIWILFGASIPAFLNSYVFESIFKKYIPTQEEDTL